ncbi:MAG TPA: Ig-like domain-containing protein [Bacteroidales bacterium]|nr:Ig-like domain-containing protein [Bacteroidales bacterium]
MKKYFLLIAVFFCIEINAIGQHATIEYPWAPFNMEEFPTASYDLLDSLEVSARVYYLRTRGYLIPPQTGYYKFYMLGSSRDWFNLSIDSMEYHKRKILFTNYFFQCNSNGDEPWPDTLPTTNHPCVNYIIDSVFLNQGLPYYFETLHKTLDNLGIHGVRWTLPGTNLLTAIKHNHLRPPIPKHLGAEPVQEIFEHEFTCDFTELKSRSRPPDQKTTLHTLSTQSQENLMDNYTTRTRGYIYPEVNGNYSFYFACDDAGQFWLSPDSTAAGAQLKSYITAPDTNWNHNVSSQYLVAQQKYFFEILQYDSTGPGYFNLGWGLQGDTLPVTVSFTYLSNSLVSVLADSVTLAGERMFLMPDQTCNAVALVHPWNAANGALQFSSTNPIVASVDGNGLVSGNSPGECMITVRLVSNPNLADTMYVNVNRLYLELFKDRMAVGFDTLRNTTAFPDERIAISELSTTEHLSTLDYFASRIRGYILTPISGNYSFFMGCDDKGQFWLSSDSTEANAQMKMATDTALSDWNLNTSTQYLAAGHKYFFELLHYDSVYTDNARIGWIFPGDSVIMVIGYPYLRSIEDNVSVTGIYLKEEAILAYPNWAITPNYYITSWNSTNQEVIWQSSNNAIATVNTNGTITTLSPGSCLIIAQLAQDTTLSDTLTLTVTDYYGPYFVKQNADLSGDGQSWDNAISLTKLLEKLNQGTLSQQINVYVAEGTYKPTTNFDRNKSFILNNVRFAGGFASSSIGTDTTNRDYINSETILSGEIGIPDNTYDNTFNVVVTRGASTIIDGVTIRDGRANSLIYGDGNWYGSNENNGGGIYVQSENAFLVNCKIINNSAINSGAGIFCGYDYTLFKGRNLTVQNCKITGNLIQQEVQNNGGTFTIVVNGYGAGLCVVQEGNCNLENCIFSDNSTPFANGKALAVRNSLVNIHNCSFFNNLGSRQDLWTEQSTLYMNNSTIVGSFILELNSTSIIRNSTIIGGGYITFDGNTLVFDNSLWTEPNLSFYEGTTNNSWQAKFSILGDSLFGANKDSIISVSIPDYTTWLDSLAYNGGSTPTMKLKNIPNNPAKSNGNPLYLDSLDQRGYVRHDSVSIGAYQWIHPTDVLITPKQVVLCPGDSIGITLAILPSHADDTSCFVTSLDESIALVSNSKIYAISPGLVDIVVHTMNGNQMDTCHVIVLGLIGTGTITGETTVYQGQESVTYTVAEIENATSYIWTLPSGATGTSSTNSIDVDFGLSAISGDITVKGTNDCGDGAVSTLAITVNAMPATQIVHIPKGWSGLSSYVDPENPDIIALLESIEDAIIILYNYEGMYFPAQNINTLQQWNAPSGYFIKTQNEIDLTFLGSVVVNKTVALEAGWNLIPVFNPCGEEVTTLFDGLDVLIIKEIAGSNLYWPQYNINTLQQLQSGKAYLVLMQSPGTITFTDCE